MSKAILCILTAAMILLVGCSDSAAPSVEQTAATTAQTSITTVPTTTTVTTTKTTSLLDQNSGTAATTSTAATTFVTEAVTTPTQAPTAPTEQQIYRVRRFPDDAASQLGAFHSLDNAIACCDEAGDGYYVFNNVFDIVYPADATIDVDLSYLVIDYASSDILSGDHHEYAIPNDQYAQYAMPIAFEAVGTVTNLQLMELEIDYTDDDFYSVTNTYSVLDTLSEDKPLVAYLAFPHDMSAWVVSYDNEYGESVQLRLFVSLEDGSLVVSEF